MAIIRTWRQTSSIEIDEVEFDGDRHAFEVCVDGRHVVTVYADSPEDTEVMRLALDLGGDVRDWDDGNGNCVGTLIRQRTGDGLRETLRRLENAGTCYNSRLFKGGVYGTLWVDKVYDIYYEYETDDMDLGVNDLMDEDLKNVVIGGL
jgi:hypothetical protein